MKKPRKKKQSLPHQAPPISPDALLHPLLLQYAEKLRKGKHIDFGEKFVTSCRWEDPKELGLIHDGIREWHKQGTPDRLAALLKADPSLIVHPVITIEIRHLKWLSTRVEKGDSRDDWPSTEEFPQLFPQGTRYAARNALLTIFQGMWSAFSSSTTLFMKPLKVPGRKKTWEKWEMGAFLEEYNSLKAHLEKLDIPTDATERPLRRRVNESNADYLNRIIEVVRKLDSLSNHAFKSVKIRTGTHKGEWTISKNP